MFLVFSNFAYGVDRTFLFIMAIAFLLLLGITTSMVIFAIKYSRKRHSKAVQVKDNITIEIIWTLVPIVLVLSMFYYGHKMFSPEKKAQKETVKIKLNK
jgi:cytochrome c oxidase subunit 2